VFSPAAWGRWQHAPERTSRRVSVQERRPPAVPFSAGRQTRRSPPWGRALGCSASDWAATRLAVAIERVAEALLVEEEQARIVPAHELMRARP
jgi:hypothetical protein